MSAEKQKDYVRSANSDPLRQTDDLSAASFFNYTTPATVAANSNRQDSPVSEPEGAIVDSQMNEGSTVSAEQLPKENEVVMPAEEQEREGNPIRYTVGKPKSGSEKPANYYKDVRYVMDKLLEIELLSTESHAQEYPAEPREIFLMYPTPSIVHVPSPFVSHEDLPETIKAINEFQTEIIGWDRNYSRVDPGLTTIERLDAATVESVAADREKVKRDRAAEARRKREEAARKKEQERVARIEAEQERRKQARIQRIKDEPRDEGNIRRIFEEHESLEELGCFLVDYAVHHPEIVYKIIDYAGFWSADDVAEALVIAMDDSTLRSLNLYLLRLLSDELDAGWTGESQSQAMERVQAAMKSENDRIFSEDGPGSANEGVSQKIIRHRIGDLSKKYESGNRGAGTVSTGKGDKGGVSYGIYQLASKLGRPEEFLNSEGKEWKSLFGKHKSGSSEFSEIWKKIAEEEEQKFGNAQHNYIKKTHYDIQRNKLKNKLNLDIDSRSSALKDVVWSTSVQHGPHTSLIISALKNINIETASDKLIITRIYNERGREDDNGVLVHFSGNSSEVQTNVKKRFVSELKDSMDMLGGN